MVRRPGLRQQFRALLFDCLRLLQPDRFWNARNEAYRTFQLRSRARQFGSSEPPLAHSAPLSSVAHTAGGSPSHLVLGQQLRQSAGSEYVLFERLARVWPTAHLTEVT